MNRSNEPARGIAPALLLSQVRNTAPYLFDDDSPLRDVPPVALVRARDRDLGTLSHAEYFALCLSAHYLTCATPVPTDVDNQIRKKLWPSGLPLVTALEMSALVLDSQHWDFAALSNRSSYGAAGSEWEHVALNGHRGEWLTVASAAYAALAPYKAQDAKQRRQQLLDAIHAETERHSEVFGSVWRANDGIGALEAAASIAHDFGDLDRVIDAWDVPVADPLRLHYYALGTAAFDSERRLRHKGRLWAAGELYKASIDGSSMALENHRHFALRKPRALRSHPSLRVPLGPFFDAWGSQVAAIPDEEDLAESIDALVLGAERMPSTFGYARALHAIEKVRPDAVRERLTKVPKSKRLRTLLDVPRETFEARWSSAALAHLEEIPSRA